MSLACGRNFGRKYLVGDSLKATCAAPFKIEVQTSAGARYESELLGVELEVSR